MSVCNVEVDDEGTLTAAALACLTNEQLRDIAVAVVLLATSRGVTLGSIVAAAHSMEVPCN